MSAAREGHNRPSGHTKGGSLMTISTDSRRSRMQRLLPVALASAGIALGAIAIPAIAQADPQQDKWDYLDCIHQPGADQEVCCALHNGEWGPIDSRYPGLGYACSFESQAVTPQPPGHNRIPGDISNQTLTPAPTKPPQPGR